ncbi:MAG: hypothetical protein RL328_2009 [Acidobacteriota bacterium]|jgi:hypothetical protein
MNVSAISSRSALGKALRYPLRLIPAGTRMPILKGPLRGKRWICGAGTHGAAVHAECCALLREAGYALRALDGAAVEASRELAGVSG